MRLFHSLTPDGRNLGPGPVLVLGGILAAKLVLYALITPPWQVADEPTHFEYAYLLYRDGVFASVEQDPALQREILKSMAEYRFWSYLPWSPPDEVPESFREAPFLQGAATQLNRSQPLYYVLGGLWLRAFRPESLLSALYLLRFLSVFLILAFFSVSVLLVRWALPGYPGLQLLALSFVVFLPQLAAIGGGVNSDNAIILTYSLTILVCALYLRSTPSLGLVVLLGLAIALSVLSKRTGLLAIPLALGAVVLSARARAGVSYTKLTALLAGLALAGLLGHAALTWISPETARKVVNSFVFGVSRLMEYEQLGGDQSPGMVTRVLWESFWGRMGWLTVGPPSWTMLPHLSILLVVLVGAAAYWRQGPSTDSPSSRRVFLMLSLSGLLVIAAALVRNMGDFQPHGRYLFPALPAFAVWLGAGANAFSVSIQRWLVPALTGWLCLFDLAALLRYAIPGFYAPPLV